VRWWSRHHVSSGASGLALLTAAAAALFVAAGAGMAYVAGFDRVRERLVHPHWFWLVVAFAFVVLSFGGYYLAYRGIGKVEGGPDDLDLKTRLAAVTAGFGGFLAHGGSAIDDFVMREAGASEREANVRVTLLGGLEHGMLAVPCIVAAIYLLVAGIHKPPLDFVVPWVAAPPIGFAIAFWAAERYRKQLRHRDGWRGKLGILLDAIHLVRELFLHPGDYWHALVGMVLFWVADMFALWAAVAAFGFRMNGASEVIAFGTAMIVTRRTGPLGGAGILQCAIVPTLWISGAPYAAAALGAFAYRFFTLWIPLPFSFAALPHLRRLAREHAQDGEGVEESEPALPA
jgi:uncharacterized membrane protein YbhN (UPF0104 family)